MINICNIFKPIDKESGNFLLFSQYTQDLSRSTVNPSYKVRPSRFVCMNISSSHISALNTSTGLTQQQSIPGYLQNYFENGVAVARNNYEEVSDFNFSLALWDRLIQITKKSNGAVDIHNCIKYVGEIDTEYWDQGFADILLDITSGSVGKTISFNPSISPSLYVNKWIGANGSTRFTTDAGEYSYSNNKIGSKYYISGWSNTDSLPISPEVSQNASLGLGLSNSIFSSSSSVFDQLFVQNDSTSESFTFNTILVLYNVLDADNNILSYDIPMGLYFTGDINSNTITNPVTIFKSSSDVYGVGSGWSLRICTRFSPTPQGYLKLEEVALESGALTESISALLGASAEVIQNLNKFTQDSWNNSQTIKDLYAIFKNSRTNVPYVREINGVGYWFVNGRNTGATITGEIDV